MSACVFKGINLQRENAHFAFWRGQQWYYSNYLNIVGFHAFLKVNVLELELQWDSCHMDKQRIMNYQPGLLHYNFDFLFCSYDEIENTLWIKLGSLARCSVSYWYLPNSAAAIQPTYLTDHTNSLFHYSKNIQAFLYWCCMAVK